MNPFFILSTFSFHNSLIHLLNNLAYRTSLPGFQYSPLVWTKAGSISLVYSHPQDLWPSTIFTTSHFSSGSVIPQTSVDFYPLWTLLYYILLPIWDTLSLCLLHCDYSPVSLPDTILFYLYPRNKTLFYTLDNGCNTGIVGEEKSFSLTFKILLAVLRIKLTWHGLTG